MSVVIWIHQFNIRFLKKSRIAEIMSNPSINENLTYIIDGYNEAKSNVTIGWV